MTEENKILPCPWCGSVDITADVDEICCPIQWCATATCKVCGGKEPNGSFVYDRKEDAEKEAMRGWNERAKPKQRTREEEIEDFERMISDDYKNMEKIEKSGCNYMHSRTNTAFWVWLARAELDRE